LLREDELQLSSIEEILASIHGHDAWKSTFATRYVDFTPIQGC
jgi:hypothetical protein